MGTDTSHIIKDYSGSTPTERGGFDPADIKKYHGYTFITRNSSYKITPDGRITGRESTEGAKIKLITGAEDRLYPHVMHCLSRSRPELRDELDELIRENAQKVKEGLRLVISLTPKSAKEKDRNGMITSHIKKIIEKPEYVH